MKLGQNEKRETLGFWNKDAHAQTLRVQLTDGSFYIFPYSRLQFARFERRTDQDQLHLVVDTHEIQIIGKHLHELGLAFQKLAVDWVRELPARYATTPNPDQAYIGSIKVTEIQAP